MKSLMFMFAHIAVGGFVLWAIWPALQGSNDGYMTKTEGVVIAEVDPSTPEPAPQPEPTPTPVPKPVITVEPAVEPIPEPKEGKVDNEKEDEVAGALYSVVDGNKLDAESYAGFKLYRNWCARCHGTYGQGMAGPDLAESLQIITEKEFFTVVEKGKTGSIGSMPAWRTNPKVMAGRDQIYAYLMARSDGAIGKVKPKKQ